MRCTRSMWRGCVYNAITLNKDIYAPDPYICSAAKHLVKWAIDKWSKEITLSSDYSILTETQRKNLLQNLSFRDGLSHYQICQKCLNVCFKMRGW